MKLLVPLGMVVALCGILGVAVSTGVGIAVWCVLPAVGVSAPLAATLAFMSGGAAALASVSGLIMYVEDHHD